MLQNTKELIGYKLAAFDGNIGHVKDLYFNDKNWTIRYLVVDTGPWLKGRPVLLSPHSIGILDRDSVLHVKLTRDQIEKNPPVESDLPIFREYEETHRAYYGMPAYREGKLVCGSGDFPVSGSAPKEETCNKEHAQCDNVNLSSMKTTKGYAIEATDGVMGSVKDFMVNDETWVIDALIIEAGHWYSSKEVMIPTRQVERVCHKDSKVFVSLTKANIQDKDEDEVAKIMA